MTKDLRMQKTILGFVPVESPIYAIHPMVRLVIYFAMSMIPLCVQMPEVNFALFLLLMGLFVYAKIDFRKIKLFLPMIITVGIFITLMYTFFPIVDDSRLVIGHIGKFNIYFYSMIYALSVYFRIILLIFSSVFYFFTNRERDILIAFRKFKVPFAASYFIGLTLRSAGMFIEDYRTIREAERSRGMFVEDLGFFKKIKHFAMYMIPLFTLAIRRSEEISIALYAKGTSLSSKIDGKKRPDLLVSQTPAGVVQTVQIIFGVVLIGVFVYLNAVGVFSISHSILNTTLRAVLTAGR